MSERASERVSVCARACARARDRPGWSRVRAPRYVGSWHGSRGGTEYAWHWSLLYQTAGRLCGQGARSLSLSLCSLSARALSALCLRPCLCLSFPLPSAAARSRLPCRIGVASRVRACVAGSNQSQLSVPRSHSQIRFLLETVLIPSTAGVVGKDTCFPPGRRVRFERWRCGSRCGRRCRACAPPTRCAGGFSHVEDGRV